MPKPCLRWFFPLFQSLSDHYFDPIPSRLGLGIFFNPSAWAAARDYEQIFLLILIVARAPKARTFGWPVNLVSLQGLNGLKDTTTVEALFYR